MKNDQKLEIKSDERQDMISNCSTFLGESVERLFLRISPAFEKMRSDGTEVVGIIKYLSANLGSSHSELKLFVQNKKGLGLVSHGRRGASR